MPKATLRLKTYNEMESVIQATADHPAGSLTWYDAVMFCRWLSAQAGFNEEQQCYTDRPDNTYLSDGILHIRAQIEEFSGIDGSEDWDNADQLGTKTLPYTSGRIRTKDKGDWRYGRFEIRALLPYGQGMWPAVWMLPTDNTYGGWAASGEIDIVEAVNLKTVFAPDNNAVHGTLHYGAEWPANAQSGTFLQLFDEQGTPAALVYKGPAPGDNPYAVDGLSGATITSRGVTNLIRYWTSDDGYGPFLKKLRAQWDAKQSTDKVAGAK